MAWYKCIGNGGSPTPSEGDPYIVGMGTAYSELPVYSDENDILKIKFKFKNTDETTDNKTVIGSAFSGNSDYLLYMSVENGQPIYAYAVANNYTYIKAPRSTTEYDDIELGYDYMIVNGTTYTSQTPAKHSVHRPIYLFGNDTYKGSGVFGEVKIYKNDVLTYDLVPSLNSSDIACFKDVLNSDTEYLSAGTEYYYFKDGNTKRTQPIIIPVFNNAESGSSTYTILEDGLYLIEVSNSYSDTRSITLPSGRTPIVNEAISGNSRGTTIEIVELKSGDEITLSATASQWASYSKNVFLLRNIEVLSVYDTDYADDTTLTYNSIPSTDDYYMTIGVCFGRQSMNYYDSTVNARIPLEQEDFSGTTTLGSIRLDKGKNFPELSYYGYDGGGAYLCVLNVRVQEEEESDTSRLLFKDGTFYNQDILKIGLYKGQVSGGELEFTGYHAGFLIEEINLPQGITSWNICFKLRVITNGQKIQCGTCQPNLDATDLYGIIHSGTNRLTYNNNDLSSDTNYYYELSPVSSYSNSVFIGDAAYGDHNMTYYIEEITMNLYDGPQIVRS